MKKLRVHLNNSTCIYNMWQLTGILYVHVIVAIAKKGDRVDTYVNKWLKMDAFRATYGHSISSIKNEDYWKKSIEINSIPPKIKKPIGCPIKRRRPDLVKDRPESTKVKKTFRVTCEKCGKPGHNSKTCKGALKIGTNAEDKVKEKSKKKLSNNSVSVSAETMTAATSGTTFKLFKFILTPGLNVSKKK
ncbi:hypothetical protein Ahy_B05g074858 [Arachis hypogaea]|uniref:CCHC-type domain-containing protein n=1 Tax=Arachis hypogaea TaxID=3818 RepID=A0A444Z018_ARAHY|nr:hypothetical protein Ahy_B05g074858 [Arachis hypogaea]